MNRFELTKDISTAARLILRIVLIVGLALVLWFGAGKAYHIGYSVFTTGAMAEEPGRDVVVTISEDMSDYSVGKLLKSKGLIEDSFVYMIQAQVYDYKPVPGTYLLNTSETLPEMMKIMMEKVEEESGSDTGSPVPESNG